MIRFIFITKDGLVSIEPKGIRDIGRSFLRPIATNNARFVNFDNEDGFPGIEYSYREYALKEQTQNFCIYEEV